MSTAYIDPRKPSLTDGLPLKPKLKKNDDGPCIGCSGCGEYRKAFGSNEMETCGACNGSGRKTLKPKLVGTSIATKARRLSCQFGD